MANHLRVRVLLNKGKKTVSLRRLPRLLAEIQKFIELLAADTVGNVGEWLGEEFRSTSSLEYTALSSAVVETDRIDEFDRSLKSVIESKPDPKLRHFTLAQYARIAEPLDGDTVSFGIGSALEETGESAQKIEWLEVNRAAAVSLVGSRQVPIKSYGSVQGKMHSVFLTADPPYFKLRELSTGDLVTCEYNRDKYHEIVEALELEGAVLHVYGRIVTDLVNRTIQRLTVSRIEISTRLTREDLDRFIGCVPGLLGGDSLQNFIDEMRDRERQ